LTALLPPNQLAATLTELELIVPSRTAELAYAPLPVSSRLISAAPVVSVKVRPLTSAQVAKASLASAARSAVSPWTLKVTSWLSAAHLRELPPH
jgi:hypothetical protein